MKAIKKELGEDEGTVELKELEERSKQQTCQKNLKKLQ
ncbi:hypothetical protein Ct9H90mP29_01810 [bacterium]|nr:MAG: hypothetical protein Ct9H90mP29_01810 [bacterium]